MKISFCLSYSSIMFPHNILLLFAMQLLIFVFNSNNSWIFAGGRRFRIPIPSPLRVVGSNGLLANWLLCNQVALAIFAHSFLMELWWAQMDSDHRPHAYQACALTSWAMSPHVVEVIGFEPMTPCLQGRCSTSWAIPPSFALFRKINAPLS